ncbi:MAG: hypothetical protein NTZ10_03050 [Candidatus Saganbacteria bacterium]|nr:hypothetical protein [Candidatus Saganbacteria bacterium]
MKNKEMPVKNYKKRKHVIFAYLLFAPTLLNINIARFVIESENNISNLVNKIIEV